MQRLKEKSLKQKKAAEMLGVSERHIRRLLQGYRQHGDRGLISKRRGKRSNNYLDPDVKQKAIDQLHSRYHDFGPTLAHEKLSEVHGLKLSVESVRQIMIAEELWEPRKVKRKVIHQMRLRRACRGELVQIDGSPHAWFEDRGPVCNLLVYIDDATGELMALFFAPAESTFSYFAATRRYLKRHGRPVAFYSDKHGIFRVNAKNALSGTGMTQFGRAMKALDIDIICANTPQAKGRVERAILTLQDRLVKELRLQGISTIEEANDFRTSKISTAALPFSLAAAMMSIAPYCIPKMNSTSFFLAKRRAFFRRTSPYNTTRSSIRSKPPALPMLCARPRLPSVSTLKVKSPFSTRENPCVMPSSISSNAKHRLSCPKKSIPISRNPTSLPPIIPGANMDAISMANRFRTPFLMALIEIWRWCIAFFAFEMPSKINQAERVPALLDHPSLGNRTSLLWRK
jgi:transposase